MQRPSLTRAACVGACLIGAALAPAPALAASGSDVRTGADDGATWLEGKQDANGSWVAPFGGVQVPSALAAAGRHAADVAKPNGTTAQDFIQSRLTDSTFVAPTDPANDALTRPGTIEQYVLQAYSAGFDPARVAANQNLIAQLAAYYDDGYFHAGDASNRATNYSAFGALALVRTGAPQFLIDRVTDAVRANQLPDGGWDFRLASDSAAESSPDSTGASIAALCEAGATANDAAVRQGVAHLRDIQQQTGGVQNGEGGFGTQFQGAQYPPDPNSTGAAVQGLNACGIDPQGTQFQTTNAANTPLDFLLATRVTGGADDGGYGFFPGATSADIGVTQDVVRALAGGSLLVEPPARAVSTQSRTRALPTVADGTSVPLSLAVDDGAGGVTFCRVSAPSGTSLAGVLSAAGSSSAPSGCATGAAFTGGQLSNLNGKTGTWTISIDRGAEQVAAGQAVRFGDFVALRRTSAAVPATPAGPTATPVPAAVQARTVAAATTAKSLKFSAKKRTVTVPVSCALDNRSCQGTVYVIDGKTTLGRRPFTIGGGKTTSLGVKLYAKPLKRFGRKSKKVRVNVFSRDGNGVASTSSRIVTFTRGS